MMKPWPKGHGQAVAALKARLRSPKRPTLPPGHPVAMECISLMSDPAPEFEPATDDAEEPQA